MSQLKKIPAGDSELPDDRDQLWALVVFAATLLGALAITDGNVESAILVVTSLRGLVR